MDALWRVINGITNGASWDFVGPVSASGACMGGSYTVSGTLSGTEPTSVNLAFRLSGCVSGESITYSGTVSEVGSFSGTGTTQRRNMVLSSKDLTASGTLGSSTLDGYAGCALNASIDSSFHEAGSLCGRSFSNGAQAAGAGGTAGGGGSCSASCPSTCGGNVPEQACLYCQAACICACSKDPCEAQNRAAAAALGTTNCP